MQLPEYEFDAVVIGAGVVGIAIARALALQGQQTLLLEAEGQFGSGVSSRNSEVIHAGIYYPPGSLKGRLCVEGRALLYDYCAARQVAHQRLGKLIVATDEDEAAKLDDYLARARANGVDDLRLLSRTEALALEPDLHCRAALLSPSTGIVDAHGLMFALLTDFEQAGGTFVSRSPVRSIRPAGAHLQVEVQGADAFLARAPRVVNSAGLGAQAVAHSVAGIRAEAIPPLHYAIGHYFTLQGRTPFRRLVYPVAAKGGLGIHLTLDLAGRARFGPDISWREHADYRFDETRAAAFYTAIRRYYPALQDGSLAPAYTGIRPKIAAPGQPDADFLLQDHTAHGIPGLLNLFGIESPGLTAALALAREAATRLA